MENKEKPALSKSQKKIVISWYIFCAFILIVAAVIFIYNTYTPKANYNGFKAAIASYLDQNSDDAGVIIENRYIFKVNVSDKWYNLTDNEKLTYCKKIYDAIDVNSKKYKLIYKDKQIPYVSFYDKDNQEVAKQDKSEFTILRWAIWEYKVILNISNYTVTQFKY